MYNVSCFSQIIKHAQNFILALDHHDALRAVCSAQFSLKLNNLCPPQTLTLFILSFLCKELAVFDWKIIANRLYRQEICTVRARKFTTKLAQTSAKSAKNDYKSSILRIFKYNIDFEVIFCSNIYICIY